MKRIALLGLIVCVVAAATAWLVIPIYAQHRFEASLNEYFAGRGDARASYRDADYDYWNQRATISEISDVVESLIGDQPMQVLVKATDVVLQGVNLDSTGEPASSGDGSIAASAESVSWSALSAQSDGDAVALASAAGVLDGVSIAHLVLADARSISGTRIAQGNLGPTRLSVISAAGQTTAEFESMRMSSVSRQGAGEVALTDLSLQSDFDTDGRAGEITASWGALVLTELERGEPTVVSRIVQEGMNIDFVLPGLPAQLSTGTGTAPATPGTPPTPLKGSFKYGDLRAEQLRVDEWSVGTYLNLIDAMVALDGEAPSPHDLAVWAESFMTLLERTDATATGADSLVITGMAMDFPGLQQQSFDRLALTGQRGLKVERMKLSNHVQTDYLGNRFATQNAVVSNFDFSALPAFLRKVLGSPVTAQSLEQAGDRFQASLLAGELPPLDYGKWEVSSQMISLANGPMLTFDQMGWEPLTIDDEGRVRTAISLAGITVPIATLRSHAPNGQAAVAALRAQGIESLSLAFDFATLVDLKQGSVHVEGVRLAAERLADVTLDAAASGIKVAQLAQVPPEQRVQAAMISTAFDGATLTLRDEGLRQIAFALLGQNGSAPPEQVAQALSAQAEQFVASIGGERAAQLGATAARFVRDGGTLRLRTGASEPIPIVALMQMLQTQGPPALLELLQLEAQISP